MRQSLARFSEPVSSVHAPSCVDFITATPAFKLSVHTKATTGLREDQLVDLIRELGRQPGPDRRRSGPHPERISSCYIKALRSSELGSSFGAYSHANDVGDADAYDCGSSPGTRSSNDWKFRRAFLRSVSGLWLERHHPLAGVPLHLTVPRRSK